MTGSTQANIHISAKGMYEDEKELLSMLKIAYKDYWTTKTDGQPRLKQSEGNYWIVNSRVHRMGNGEPLIEKEICYKNTNGEKVRIQDEPRSPGGSLNRGLERERETIEEMAFLSTGYEAHERSIGDIIRIDESAQKLDLFHIFQEGQKTRELLAQEHEGINSNPEDQEIVSWQVISPEMENWRTLKEELSLARKSGAELEIPPTDGGIRRFEKNEQPVTTSEGARSQTDERIKFG